MTSTRSPSFRWLRHVAAGALLVLPVGSCRAAAEPLDLPLREDPLCELDPNLLFASLPPGAVPSLTEPEMVTFGGPGTEYLLLSDRVLGVVIDGEARAYPHNILWHHEIVNDRVGDQWLTVTFCPLTGSGLVFDPHVGGEKLDIGVSGLLFANNLVLYDRTSMDVYGPQLSVEGKCSRFVDRSLKLLPVQETSWGRWLQLHSNTKVVSSETGYGRNYLVSPYANYTELSNSDLLFAMDVDRTRPLKERVLAIRVGEGGRGYPFGQLASLGDVAVINDTIGGEPTAIFYEARDGETAVALNARVGDQTLTFDAGTDGLFTDRETGTRWRIDGFAQSGPLAGERLSARSDAYVVFWFAWRHFQPEGTVWLR